MDLSNPNLVLHYKAEASKHGLLVMIATSPIWALWMPWVVSWLVAALLAAGLAESMDLFFLMLFFIAVTMLAIFTVLVCRDNTLTISERGIKLPMRFLLHSLGRRQFNWRDLKMVAFQTAGKPSLEPDDICFHFKPFIKVPLHLDGFERDDISKILLAVEAYAPGTPFLPQAEQIAGEGQIRKLSPLSFTQLWEEELNSRFGSTIFVPMEAGHVLQNGRIKIVGQIAFGGLSAIYLAKLDGQKLVAVKEAVVPQNADESCKAKALDMFKRESQLLLALNHPRIAQVYDHFVEKGHHYLILQYIEGKDLRTYIKENGSVSEEVVARWAAEIADIVYFLHEQSPPLIHRDLTPDNLVLARDGSISLIDFGAANEFMGTATGTLVGKQAFISPEQFRGKAVPASDLYSLGGTLHFLLTGSDPEALSVSRPKSLNSAISEEMDALVAALTAQETADRLCSAQEAAIRAREIVAAHRLKFQMAAHHES